MMKLFIFQTGRIQRHRIAVFVLNKLIGLFFGKLGKDTLHHRLQPVKRTVHLDTETAMHIGSSVFQNDCIHDAEQSQHPLMAKQHPGPGKTEILLIFDRFCKRFFGIFHHILNILQQKCQEDIFLATKIIIQVAARKIQLPPDLRISHFVVSDFHIQLRRHVCNLFYPYSFLLPASRSDKIHRRHILSALTFIYIISVALIKIYHTQAALPSSSMWRPI